MCHPGRAWSRAVDSHRPRRPALLSPQRERVWQDPETVGAMAAVEGDACPPDEHKRFQTIVCRVEETCGCADTLCKLDWCAGYVHEWRKEFAACTLKGCGPA
ncbi:unnamed protein product [Prorocentrum cordatum]|uniref:Uncharacterized protein n=1 Tax=Prorocentrum cordatum TaxID=2364126 RepID=A0ABN9Q6Y0_9DINO|nr:unnamed protein product [Polarella glacialis]